VTIQADDVSANAAAFCREQIQGVDPLFRISSLFADKEVAERLLPLYALFACVEQLCASVSDESVAIRKLEWWRGALTGNDKASGEHPVIAELNRSGAMERLPQDSLARLLDMVAYRIEAPPTPGVNELARLCRMTGSPPLELELAVAGNTASQVPSAMAARRGLIQLLREDLGRERSSWWLPLGLMAKYGVRRADIPGGEASGAVKDLLTEAVDGATSREAASNTEIIDISFFNQNDRHIFVYDELCRRKLEYTKKSSYEKRREILFRPRAGDLFCCWNAARRFSRQK
jgi:phytoene/squalene synthetase